MRLGPRRSPSSSPPGRADLADLMDGAGLAGLGDGELLARFVARGDEAAFEGLVRRHGAMVLGTCRRMLGAGSGGFGADDAFQATFLVLVRRAGSVGRGDLIGPWLHAVAVRVCRRARARGHRRAGRERTGPTGELALLAAPDDPAPDPLDRAETRALIDEAIARLPERDRALIVLADVEGLSRPEVADRLGWTPNMVRGRLARARSRLRANLARRGCAPVDAGESAPLAVSFPWLAPPAAPLVAATTRLAVLMLTPTGRRLAAALAVGPACTLADGIARMLVLTSWKIAGAGLVAVGALAAGAATAVLAPQAPATAPGRDPMPAVPGPTPAPPPGVAGPTAPPAPSARPGDPPRQPPTPLPAADAPLATLLEARLAAARTRFEAQKAFYEEGRITMDRLIDASRQVMQAELMQADTPDRRRAAIRGLVDRLGGIHERERQGLEVGRATAADLAEVEDALLDARVTLAREGQGPPAAPMPTTKDETPMRTPGGLGPRRDPPRVAELRQARIAAARTIFDETSRLYPGEVSDQDFLHELQAWGEIELSGAATPEARAAAIRSQIAVYQKALTNTERLAAQGSKKTSEVARERLALIDARIRAETGQAPPDTAATADLDRRLSELERKVDRLLDFIDNRPRPNR